MRGGDLLKRVMWPWGLLFLILAVYVADVCYWLSLGDVWLHTDGHIHYERTRQVYRLFTESLPGQDTWLNLAAISGYGPLLYLLSLPFVHFLGGSYLTTVLVQGLFGVAGGVGSFLLGRELAGPGAGLFSAAVLVSLPMYRIHTGDVMLDFAGTGLCLLALGCFAASSFLRSRAWTALAAVCVAAALLTRWPHVLGIGPLLLWMLLASVWVQSRRLPWVLGVGALFSVLGGIAGAAFMWAPQSLFEGYAPLGVAALSLPLSALGWRLAGQENKLPLWGNMLLLVGVLGFLMGPYYVFARSSILGAIDVQVGMGDIVDAYSTPLYAGVLGKVLVVLNIAYKWEWGPLLFPWMILGSLYFTVFAKGKRLLASLALIFAISLDAGIIAIKPPVVERWLFPSAMAVIPLGISLPFAFRQKWPKLLLVPAVLLCFYNAYAWHWADAPGRISPRPWRMDVKVYNEPCCAFGQPGFAEMQSPLMTFAPYKTEYDWHMPESFLESFGGKEILIGTFVDQWAREDFMPVRSIGNLERYLQQIDQPFFIEDVLDRDRPNWRDYDAWLIVQKPGGALMPKVAQGFGSELNIYLETISQFRDLEIYLLWRQDGPLLTDIETRLAGKNLMTPGYGHSEGRSLEAALK